jgi:tetratricopeptide (TPR) repeat protein
MDKMMRDLAKLLQQQEFESIEEANAFLEQFQGGPMPEMPAKDEPLSRAQDLVYQAYEAPSRAKAVKLARQALELSPDCAEAYVLLAEAEAKTVEQARAYYQKGVEAGERALGPEAFEEDVGHFWGLLETRPYMRARQGLAETLWLLGEEAAAIEHYEEMLRLNPGDNQGIRYLLADCLLEVERDEDLAALLEQYPDDASASWMYGRALLLFRQEGDSDEANVALEAALAYNEHVPDYLLGRKKLPKQLPAYRGFGDENEAVDYASTGLALWRGTYGAIRWLRKHAPGRF